VKWGREHNCDIITIKILSLLVIFLQCAALFGILIRLYEIHTNDLDTQDLDCKYDVIMVIVSAFMMVNYTIYEDFLEFKFYQDLRRVYKAEGCIQHCIHIFTTFSEYFILIATLIANILLFSCGNVNSPMDALINGMGLVILNSLDDMTCLQFNYSSILDQYVASVSPAQQELGSRWSMFDLQEFNFNIHSPAIVCFNAFHYVFFILSIVFAPIYPLIIRCMSWRDMGSYAFVFVMINSMLIFDILPYLFDLFKECCLPNYESKPYFQISYGFIVDEHEMLDDDDNEDNEQPGDLEPKSEPKLKPTMKISYRDDTISVPRSNNFTRQSESTDKFRLLTTEVDSLRSELSVNILQKTSK